MFGHSLDASLYFVPNSRQFVYVEPSPLKDSCIFYAINLASASAAATATPPTTYTATPTGAPSRQYVW
jgi:hypothetical protein